MHLAQLGPGRWRVKVSVGRGADGKWKQRSKVIRARTKSEARKLAQEWADSVVVDPDRITVAQLVDRFMDDTEHEPSTARSYRSRINHWIAPTLGDVRVADLDKRRLAAWRRTLTSSGLSPRTANGVIAVLKAALHWGTRHDYPVPAGATTVLRTFKADTTLHAPDPGDVVAVLVDAMRDDETFGLMLWVAAVTGCRRGELAALRWSDLDGDTLHIRQSLDQSGVVKATKTNQQRAVTLDAGTVALLAEHHRQQTARWQDHTGLTAALPPGGWMFPSPVDWDRPRSVDSISHQLTRIRGDRRVWLHGLRHGVATVLIAAGVNPRTVSARLGHSKTSMTLDVYTSPVSEQDRQAAEVIAGHLRELMGSPDGNVPAG